MEYTTSRLGLNSQTNNGSPLELFQKVYAGEVLCAFEESTVTLDKHNIRTIKEGKSVAFPTMWKMEAKYHTPGEELKGQSVAHSEKIIHIDDLLVADAFLAKIDEAMNHYDARSEYSREAGRALARVFDKNILRMGLLGARDKTGLVKHQGSLGGSLLEAEDMDSSPQALAQSIFSAAQILDEKDVPSEDRYVFLKPKHYYMLISDTKAIHKDWGGAGSYSDGKITKIAGITIVEANNLPQEDDRNNAMIKNKYKGDFTKTVGLVMHKSAVGTVKLLDVSTDIDYEARRQGTFIAAKMALGSDVLRPDACIELAKKPAASK